MSKRIGVVGIIIEDPKNAAQRVNTILSQYGHLITGRMGIPNRKENVGVIALIIEGNTDELGALTGKIGNLPGVTVKTALTAKTIDKGDEPA